MVMGFWDEIGSDFLCCGVSPMVFGDGGRIDDPNIRAHLSVLGGFNLPWRSDDRPVLEIERCFPSALPFLLVWPQTLRLEAWRELPGPGVDVSILFTGFITATKCFGGMTRLEAESLLALDYDLRQVR